jgi:hypothetical protein
VSIHKKFSDRPFQIVGVSSDNDEDKWKAFIAAQKMSWSEYIDLSGSVQALFEVHEFPTYIVLDRGGVIQMRQSGLGPETGEELQEAINKALKKPYNPATTQGIATKGQNWTFSRSIARGAMFLPSPEASSDISPMPPGMNSIS